MRTNLHLGQYFCGNKISDYGLKNNRLDYATLAKSFDAVCICEPWKIRPWEEWEQENGFIDNSEAIDELEEKIKTLENEIDSIDNGDLLEEKKDELDNLENELQELEDEEGTPIEDEIYQFFIISDNGASILKDYTNEIVYYNEELDVYIWGVTHWGTSWDYVLTDIPCNCKDAI